MGCCGTFFALLAFWGGGDSGSSGSGSESDAVSSGRYDSPSSMSSWLVPGSSTSICALVLAEKVLRLVRPLTALPLRASGEGDRPREPSSESSNSSLS